MSRIKTHFAARGIVLTCLSPKRMNSADVLNVASTTDFISRCFYPGVGIDEDPVTGSAHCELAHYYSHKLGQRSDLVGYQASSRGGYVRMSVLPASTTGIEGERVVLSGQCCVVTSSKILV